MLVAEADGERIDAMVAQKGPMYRCPECKSEVILRKGRKVVPHFAHKPPTNCRFAKGETRAHMEAKYLLFNALTTRGVKAALEYTVDTMPGDRRADVMAWAPNGKMVAFELQHTPIGVPDIERRAGSYARAGIAQIWIPFLSQSVWKNGVRTSTGWKVERYSPRQFERWVHGFHGKNGMWMYDPIKHEFWRGHFAAHMIYVESSEWYDETGTEQYAGGFSRHSKRYKELSLSGPHKADELLVKTSRRKAFSVSGYHWPACRVVQFVPTKS
ncbi:competence protein CoiA family protein [uncultured Cohaesibacter sp.]|uniref:competence protein CoiA n=1 Tax=uncultured Cohaesibacter sp. TaxID=1002546 RepID=UPI0029C96BC6|nr:competence protein CoiA family protein [uncultured Cohaesibacter sp.]